MGQEAEDEREKHPSLQPQKWKKLAVPASTEAWEGSGTLCLKTPSTGAASGSHQLSRGFRACKQPLVHPKKTKLLFS